MQDLLDPHVQIAPIGVLFAESDSGPVRISALGGRLSFRSLSKPGLIEASDYLAIGGSSLGHDSYTIGPQL